uniref:aldehyde oxygenase (deformylating) n=1 Tax=Aegilops tauschii TaxID=37682 RepID=M8BDM2_AEGTA
MASKPGPLTRWPWHDMGNYKYALVAPWAAYSTYRFAAAKARGEEGDLLSLFVLPTLLFRLLYTQLWISVSRHQTARSKHRIVSKSLDFEQVDRERNWACRGGTRGGWWGPRPSWTAPIARGLPWWNPRGLVVTALLHLGPVEFLYYWFHRALHHHFLYARYHSHHHASIVTEPVTSVIHPFAEEAVYFGLFAIPLLSMMATGTGSVAMSNAYLIYIDFMNYLGHCNFELVPKLLFDLFPPLKYLMYTPSFHSLHHTQFRTNYSLFVPFYDYLYGTMDKTSDDLYERTLHGREEAPDVVHLTHLTTPGSLLHLRLGFASLASAPLRSSSSAAASALAMVERPLAALASVFGRTAFRCEANRMGNLSTETWVVPRYTSQYTSKKDAHAGYELNRNGELYVIRKPEIKTKIVDGTSLAVAAVLHMVPRGARDVLLLGKECKVVAVLAQALCERNIQVRVVDADLHEALRQQISPELRGRLALSCSYSSKNGLPRRVMSAWRAAGIVHALERWPGHECGDAVTGVDKAWRAALAHGFRPYDAVAEPGQTPADAN